MTINKMKSTLAELFQLSKIPGNKAPFVRLCLIAATLVGGLLLTIFTLPPITQGLGKLLYAMLTGVVCSIMFAGLVWGFAKWAVFIFPKSRAVADRVWNSLYAWGIFGLAIKVMIWLYLLILPAVLYGVVLLPIGLVVYGLSLLGSEFLGIVIVVLLFVGAVCFMILLDVCTIKNLCWKQTLRTIFEKTRQAVAEKTAKLKDR